MENEDYMDFINNQIELEKLLYSVKPEDRKYAKQLFEQKKEILKKNSIFADFQLKKINKKIEKLKTNTSKWSIGF